MPYDRAAINLDQKFGKFSKVFSPHIIAQMNDLHIKATRIRGEFVWHRHEDTDELFFVHKGTLRSNIATATSCCARARCTSCRRAARSPQARSRGSEPDRQTHRP